MMLEKLAPEKVADGMDCRGLRVGLCNMLRMVPESKKTAMMLEKSLQKKLPMETWTVEVCALDCATCCAWSPSQRKLLGCSKNRSRKSCRWKHGLSRSARWTVQNTAHGPRVKENCYDARKTAPEKVADGNMDCRGLRVGLCKILRMDPESVGLLDYHELLTQR